MDYLRWIRNQWDRAAGVIGALTGLVALTLGWLGTHDALYPAQQIPYLVSGGMLGLVLVGLGATAWLSADLRDDWRKLDELCEAVRDGQIIELHAEPDGRAGIGALPAHASSDEAVARPGVVGSDEPLEARR